MYPKSTPYTQHPLFSGYDVDPLLKKEVFTLENRSAFPKKYPEKKRGYLEWGVPYTPDMAATEEFGAGVPD